MAVQVPIQSIEVPPGQRVLLRDISWPEFEAILADLGDHRASRVAYCDRALEIMTPLPEHEYFKEALGDAIKDVAEVLALDYESYGSTTWRQQAQRAGVEPDNCFYFQNEARVRGKLQLDLSQDPPPDLALEIDLTSKSLDRFPIYARLGVPELWYYDAGQLKVYRLEEGQYREVPQSAVFPGLDIRALPQVIEANRAAGRRALRQAVRAWALAQMGAQG